LDWLGCAHDDSSRHAHHGGTFGDIGHDECVGGNLCSTPNLDFTDQHCAGSDVYVIAKHRSALAAHGGGSDGDTVGDIAVSTDDGLRIDVNTPDMGEVEAAPNRGERVEAHLHDDLAKHIREKIEDLRRDANREWRLFGMDPVAKAIDHDGPNRGVEPKLLPPMAARFVPGEIFVKSGHPQFPDSDS
jgi:hypothetical protein